MKYIKVMGLSLIVLMGLVIASYAQVVVPVGQTSRQTSQLVLWYDQVTTFLGRSSLIQVTNGSLASGVTIHVQIFASDCTNFNIPNLRCIGDVRRCIEHDFNDFLTAGDTVIYDMGTIRNNSGQSVGINVDNTKGFVVVTAVIDDNDEAISFQHLFGNSYVFDVNLPGVHRLNSMGRDAVNFVTGNITPEFDLLDGISDGFVLIQPEVLKFNFKDIRVVGPNTGDENLADVITIAFKDNYNGSSRGGYAAEPAFAADGIVGTPIIFNNVERFVSCNPIPQDCFYDIGLNDFIGVANPFLDDGKVLCPGNTFSEGWVRISESGLDGFENKMGIIAISRSLDTGDATWMYVEGPTIEPTPTPTPTPIATPTPTPTPTPQACSEEDPECPPGQHCEIIPGGGICVPGAPTPTPIPPSGGGGCAVAGPVSSMGSIASMFIPLIPAFGIGLRRLLRRRGEK